MPTVRGGWLVDGSGALQVTTSGGAATFLNGGNLKSDGTVCVALEASQSRNRLNGLAYDSNSNLIIDNSGGIAVTLAGFPLTSAGAVAVSTNAVDHIGPAGIAVDSTGRIVTGSLLGPNLLTNPNGSYISAPWTATQVTEIAGQTDPLGGSTARLIADTAVSSQHLTQQSFAPANGQKYLVTVYMKAGTLLSTPSFAVSVNNNTAAYTIDINTGTATNSAGFSNLATTTVGGFYKITGNYTSNTTADVFQVWFGNESTYVGSGQNVTWWGFAVQTSP